MSLHCVIYFGRDTISGRLTVFGESYDESPSILVLSPVPLCIMSPDDHADAVESTTVLQFEVSYSLDFRTCMTELHRRGSPVPLPASNDSDSDFDPDTDTVAFLTEFRKVHRTESMDYLKRSQPQFEIFGRNRTSSTIADGFPSCINAGLLQFTLTSQTQYST